MRVIDARRGDDVPLGGVVVYPPMHPTGEDDPASYELLAVEEHVFSATATLRMVHDGSVRRVPLVVRRMHPGFFMQKVAFVPS